MVLRLIGAPLAPLKMPPPRSIFLFCFPKMVKLMVMYLRETARCDKSATARRIILFIIIGAGGGLDSAPLRGAIGPAVAPLPSSHAANAERHRPGWRPTHLARRPTACSTNGLPMHKPWTVASVSGLYCFGFPPISGSARHRCHSNARPPRTPERPIGISMNGPTLDRCVPCPSLPFVIGVIGFNL